MFNLFRVKRLGYFDHTQRQLGERALYVFPAKGDATRITCEGPEGAPVLPEDPVIRKVIHTDQLLLQTLLPGSFCVSVKESNPIPTPS